MTASVRLIFVLLFHVFHNVPAGAVAANVDEVKTDALVESTIDSVIDSTDDASTESSVDDSIDDSLEWGRRRRRWFGRRRVWTAWKKKKLAKYFKAAKKWKKLKVKKLKTWRRLAKAKISLLKKHAKSTAMKWYKKKKTQYRKWYSFKKAKYLKRIKKFMNWKKRMAKLKKTFKGKWNKFKAAKIAKWKAKWSRKVCSTIAGDVKGHDIGVTVNSNAKKCKAACKSNKACGCYAFDPSRGNRCWLKSKPCGAPSKWSESNDMTSGTCVTRKLSDKIKKWKAKLNKYKLKFKKWNKKVAKYR